MIDRSRRILRSLLLDSCCCWICNQYWCCWVEACMRCWCWWWWWWASLVFALWFRVLWVPDIKLKQDFCRWWGGRRPMNTHHWLLLLQMQHIIGRLNKNILLASQLLLLHPWSVHPSNEGCFSSTQGSSGRGRAALSVEYSNNTVHHVFSLNHSSRRAIILVCSCGWALHKKAQAPTRDHEISKTLREERQTFFLFLFWWVASGSKTLWALIFSSGYKLEEETGAFQKRSSHHFRFLELWKSRHLKKNLKTQQKPSSPPVGFKQRLQNHLQAFCGWQSFPLTHLRPKKKTAGNLFFDSWRKLVSGPLLVLLLPPPPPPPLVPSPLCRKQRVMDGWESWWWICNNNNNKMDCKSISKFSSSASYYVKVASDDEGWVGWWWICNNKMDCKSSSSSSSSSSFPLWR